MSTKVSSECGLIPRRMDALRPNKEADCTWHPALQAGRPTRDHAPTYSANAKGVLPLNRVQTYPQNSPAGPVLLFFPHPSFVWS